MILNNKPDNTATLSNVGQIGEFRIRNSAKAFNVLSSGLYSNEIRALLRELSCNAVDSHVAADKRDTPFDVHLPNQLEPWFSVRDYGTGLSHDQVTNIYTTYFESSKTESNDFIGALGLGSKSPFSYTENFTVTAVQNGRKGIYTAFINGEGVPSIALMTEEETTDPNGVEVKFSVNDRYDYEKFRHEALFVYRYFKLRPVISGYAGFKFSDPKYLDKNIIPGVHSIEGYNSFAVMGNISYPISVPNADTTLGDLRRLLSCGLVIEFGIGELDFQASREGLRYIPQTIDSIKRKLEQLNKQLAITIGQEAEKISNEWERAYHLHDRHNTDLWKSAVIDYVTTSKFALFNAASYSKQQVISIKVDDLAKDYNIVLRPFIKHSGKVSCTTATYHNEHGTEKDVNGKFITWGVWKFLVDKTQQFVINDTKKGALARAKYHYRNQKDKHYSRTVWVIEANDKTKLTKVAEFLKTLHSPPESQICKASQLLEKERNTSLGKNVSILKLEDRSVRYRESKTVWVSAGKVDEYDDTETYYYLPMIGFKAQGKVEDVKELNRYLDRAKIHPGIVFGVRKNDLDYIKTKSNWINLDEYIVEKLGKADISNVMGLVKQAIDIQDFMKYNVLDLIKVESPFHKLVTIFKDVTAVASDVHRGLDWLCAKYEVKSYSSPQSLIDKYQAEVKAVASHYPLLEHVSTYNINRKAVAEYINLIDQSKGVV